MSFLPPPILVSTHVVVVSTIVIYATIIVAASIVVVVPIFIVSTVVIIPIVVIYGLAPIVITRSVLVAVSQAIIQVSDFCSASCIRRDPMCACENDISGSGSGVCNPGKSGRV